MSITYRQLHAKKIGPQLSIPFDIHDDSHGTDISVHPDIPYASLPIDAAYAQFEQVRLKIPPDKPLAVQQWRGLIAVNYPARKFGITRHLDFDEAKKLCPDLICVHVATYAQGDSSETEAKYHDNPKPETHKVSLDPYRRESVKILKIFSESCQTIEKASIDEAFLDFSIPVREIICERYGLPTLEDLQDPTSKINMDDPLPDPPSDLDWDGLVQSSNSSVVPLDDNDNDQHSGSETHPHTWSDIALLIGAELMAECRSKVFHQLGYTCSAGIATNKMLAKLCSAYKKPDAQTILRAGAVRDFLRPFEISKIRFLGGKLGQSVSDLINDSPEKKAAGLGEDTGIWVWEIVRGVDRSEVEIKTQVKSMMSSKNFRPSIILGIKEDLFARLSEARIVTPGIWPKSIVMHKRDGTHTSYAKQISFPYTSKLTDEYIYMYGQKLLQEFSIKDQGQGSTNSRSSGYKLGAITSLALAFQSLDRIEVGQRGIQGFFAPHPVAPNPSSNQSTTAKTSSIDPSSFSNQTRNSSSTSTVQPPQELDHNSHVHLSSSSLTKTSSINPISCPPENRESSSSNPSELKTGSSTNKKQKRTTNPPSPSPTSLKFICPRCQEIITLDPLPSLHTDLVYEEGDDEEKRIRFERLKNVHLDHHFALDLSAQDQQASSSSTIHPPNQSSSGPNQQQSKNRIKNKTDILPSTSGPAKSSHSNTPTTTTNNVGVGSGNRGIKDFFKPVPSRPVLPKSKKRKK
ncbi:hypothetical protein PSTT_01109 [Puccinia striiformis]|uniref:UmuC domain-containing protein n=1 Tax=Puccinia striiformis TaxID=27350 RepID=A0A2S4W4F2_9BASI|nr:hypothetical protein PSTT_01109 [Puccinia striiformis]